MSLKCPCFFTESSISSNARMIIMSRWMRTRSAFVNVPAASSSLTLRSYWLIGIGLKSSTRRERISAGSMSTALGMMQYSSADHCKQ